MADDELDAARRQLYVLPPERFLAARAELADATENEAAAKAIGTLRKPTQPAWIVNTFAASHPDSVEALTDLGGRLAKAQADLDTGTLRELTLERRRLVGEVTEQALDLAGRGDAGTAVRDAVRGTFDAAVADPDVAARLGRLQRPESWSGFGPVAAAALSVVSAPASRPPAPSKTAPSKTAPSKTARSKTAQTTGAQNTVHPDASGERAALEAAEQELHEAEDSEQELQARLRRLTTKLTTLQHQITDVRDELDEAKRRSSAARRAKRQSRSALDREERTRPGG